MPSPCRKRLQSAWRWLRNARRDRHWLSLGGLVLCAGVWVVTVMPRTQPLEGTLEATAINFSLPPALPVEGLPFLGLSLRSLTLSSVEGTEPARIRIGDTNLTLADGDSLTLEAAAPRPGKEPVLFAQVRLLAGARVRQLQAVGSGERELSMELRPPAHDDNQAPVALAITPGQPLRARLSRGNTQAPSVPPSEFSPRLRGALVLRLLPLEPDKAVVFEPALPVRDLALEAESPSLFDGSKLIRSSLRQGELHLGLREPLQLRPDQVLTMHPPGVNELTDLRLQAKGSSLVMAVVGESTGISAGLSRKHPTVLVSGTVLSRFLSPEQIAGFYAFLGAMAGAALLVFLKVD